MNNNSTVPRFVTCIQYDPDDGNLKQYTWDKTKITVEEHLVDDILMIQNVFEGNIISPFIYPLVYDTKSPSNKEISLRSLEFYREVVYDPSLYKNLSKPEKSIFLTGIRDLFVASCRQLLSTEENELLTKIVELIDPNDDDEDIIYKRVDNIDATPYPTCKHKLVRFVEDTLEDLQDVYFIRTDPNLMLCFVDPQELSYHNFENIINLDSRFKNKAYEFSITNIEKVPECDIYTFDMTDKTKILTSLDKYNLYVQPLNKLSRGGQRFIFSSEILSRNLTSVIKDADFGDLINKKFRFVNYVFRYNKFKPNDKKFSSHFDTPYHDPARRHYSKYTLLLYLTPGQSDPVLSINNASVKIDRIDTKGDVRGVIFDQKYEHEGKSFIEGDKIFLRSELIFEFDEEDGFSFDKSISKWFNIGCYMTKQSVFNSELEKYASDCFNQAAEARLGMLKNLVTKDYLICKRYYNTSFVTNGYDYWFCNNISLKSAAVLAVLDYFNCKFKSGDYFNKLTYDEIIDLDPQDLGSIYAYLKDSLKKPKVCIKEKENFIEEEIDLDIPKDKIHCCPDHARDGPFSSFRCPYLLDSIISRRSLEKERLEEIKDMSSILILDEKIEINRDYIVVKDDVIIFDYRIPSVNFAGCWNGIYPEYLESELKLVVSYENIPPIPYKKDEDGYHLRVELFNNSFVRKYEDEITDYWLTNYPRYNYYY